MRRTITATPSRCPRNEHCLRNEFPTSCGRCVRECVNGICCDSACQAALDGGVDAGALDGGDSDAGSNDGGSVDAGDPSDAGIANPGDGGSADSLEPMRLRIGCDSTGGSFALIALTLLTALCRRRNRL